MKASDLMIYDWVVLNGLPYRVLDFDSNGIITEYCLGEPSKHESNFEPLPLTDEILKANGFDETLLRHGEYWCEYSKLYESYRFTASMSGIEEMRIYIDYVHELQHALRLCGLNELADNFKLK